MGFLQKYFGVDPHKHTWTKWEVVGSFEFDKYQERTCTECGKIQQTKVGWNLRDY